MQYALRACNKITTIRKIVNVKKLEEQSHAQSNHGIIYTLADWSEEYG